MKNISRSLGIALAAIVSAAIPAHAADFPDPGDSAKLYEAAKKESEVVWYESGPLEAMKAVAGEFEAKYPGVKVQILRYPGVAGYQRIVQEVEAKQYLADVVSFSDEPSMADLVARGYFADWRVPTTDRFPATAHMGNFVYNAYMADNAVVYNANKVTPDEVKLLADWKGILDPRFKGRLATTDQNCATCYSAVHMFLDPKFKDRFGVDFLKVIAAQKPAIYNDIVVIVDRVVAGERDVALWPPEGIALVKWTEGAPVRWLHPKPSPFLSAAKAGVLKYAPHPNAARLFQNWMMSDEGAHAIQIKYGARTALTGVDDVRPVTKESWYDPITEPYSPDIARWNRDYDKDMALWSKTLRELN